VNGTVLTPQGSTEAIAVRDGAIIAVGRSGDSQAAPCRCHHRRPAGPHADARSLRHARPRLSGGQAKLACKIPQGAGAPVIFATVKACAAKAKPGAWITGGSWVAAALKPGEQTRQLLDRAAPDNPVMLDDESLHSVWVNSRALQLGGITRATANPAGGVIDRDAKGEPTGVLREAAARNLLAVLPPVPIDQQVAAIKAATDEMLSYGIIGFTDAAIRRDGAEAYARFAATGGLRQYARGCAVWGPNSGGSEGLVAARRDYSKGRFQLDCVKMFLDGVPLEGRTAVMLQPYEPATGNMVRMVRVAKRA
jgi:predicted amidohydrolase YtcJ